jgi:hypothetical protein
MWCGDWTLARQRLDRLRDHLTTYPFAYWNPWWKAFDVVHGWRTGALDRSMRPESVSAPASDMLSDHLPTFDACMESSATLARVQGGQAGWCAPEVLRVHAETVRRGDSALAVAEATALLQEALSTARAQGALAWELRAAMSLADLWKGEGRLRSAQNLLSEVRERFAETHIGADLTQADELLRDLARASASR